MKEHINVSFVEKGIVLMPVQEREVTMYLLLNEMCRSFFYISSIVCSSQNSRHEYTAVQHPTETVVTIIQCPLTNIPE